MTKPRIENTCAIIVSYHPDVDFTHRVKKIRLQFPLTIIVDNSEDTKPTEVFFQSLLHFPDIKFIKNQTNLGIAIALNQGVKQAFQSNFEWIVTLDQDTEVSNNLLATLINDLKQSKEEKAIIGCNYWDAQKKINFITPHINHDYSYFERKTLITSGTLIPLSLFKTIGYFREDYFIDSVDHEFCLRARAYGYKILISKQPLMTQHIGENIEHSSKLRQLMSFNHSAKRKYYIARNTFFTATTYFKQEPAWCIKQFWRLLSDFIAIILFEEKKIKKSTAFGMGLVHGFLGKMGAIEETWPNGTL